MNFELVSIITPTYNSERYIERMINSVLNQSYENWELIITDDCSTDSTPKIVSQYVLLDKRIQFIQLKENSGPAVARNESIKYAKGRFIAFCDSDDMWVKEKLEVQIGFMLNNNAAFTHANVEFIDVNDRVVGIKRYKPLVNYRMMLMECAVSLQTVIYDTNKLGKFYMPLLRKRQDWGLWLLLIKKAKHSYGINQVLAQYRLVPNSVSSQKKSLIKYNILVYRNVLKFNILKSLVYFFCLYMPYYIYRRIQIKIDSYNYIK